MKKYLTESIVVTAMLAVSIGVAATANCAKCRDYVIGCDILAGVILCKTSTVQLCDAGDPTSEWECMTNAPEMLEGTQMVWDPPSGQWVPVQGSAGCQCGPYSTCWNDDTTCGGNGGGQ